MERVYLDHAATTPVDPEVAEAMSRVLRDTHGNPSSIYGEGRAARELYRSRRDKIPRTRYVREAAERPQPLAGGRPCERLSHSSRMTPA